MFLAQRFFVIILFACWFADAGQAYVWSNVFVLRNNSSSSGTATSAGLPVDFSFSAVPNPFNPSTRINLQLNEYAAKVAGYMAQNPEVRIYDCEGKLVRKLTLYSVTSGSYEAEWNGTDQNSKKLGSGIFAAVLELDNQLVTKKLMYLK